MKQSLGHCFTYYGEVGEKYATPTLHAMGYRQLYWKPLREFTVKGGFEDDVANNLFRVRRKINILSSFYQMIVTLKLSLSE